MYKILTSDKLPIGIVPAPEYNLLELYKVCLNMENACLEAGGIGLSAVQVGVPWKLFIVRVDIPDGFGERRPLVPKSIPTFRYFANCEYSPAEGSDRHPSIEGCLSLLSETGLLRYFKVDRFNEIILNGKELMVEPILGLRDVELRLKDCWLGTVVQHEIDHQREILISETGEEMLIW